MGVRRSRGDQAVGLPTELAGCSGAAKGFLCS